MRQFVKFCVGGGLALLVDAGVLQGIVSLGLDPYTGRLLSFLCAVTTTWWFNRTYTFAGNASSRRLLEWGRYVTSQVGGGAVNYAIYVVLLYAVAEVQRWPVLGVAAGSVGGLLVNFMLARRYVFR